MWPQSIKKCIDLKENGPSVNSVSLWVGGTIRDFFENFHLESAYAKKQSCFIGVNVILVRRVVFGFFVLFWWVLLEPLGGDGWEALLRKLWGSSPWL